MVQGQMKHTSLLMQAMLVWGEGWAKNPSVARNSLSDLLGRTFFTAIGNRFPKADKKVRPSKSESSERRMLDTDIHILKRLKIKNLRNV